MSPKEEKKEVTKLPEHGSLDGKLPSNRGIFKAYLFCLKYTISIGRNRFKLGNPNNKIIIILKLVILLFGL